MTSKLRGEEGGKKSPTFADFQYINFGQEGGGVNERKFFVEVISVSPLTGTPHWATGTHNS